MGPLALLRTDYHAVGRRVLLLVQALTPPLPRAPCQFDNYLVVNIIIVLAQYIIVQGDGIR